MANRTEIMERFSLISRANSFLKSRNFRTLKIETDSKVSRTILNSFFVTETNVAPITISQLDQLYLHTIYISVIQAVDLNDNLYKFLIGWPF